MKHIQIQNLDIISKLSINNLNNKHRNCLLLPSLYFVKNATNINFINKVQLKENIFAAEINNVNNNYIFKFDKKYFKAININDINNKYKKYYLLEDILTNIEIIEGEVFKINNSFCIYQDNEFIEIPENYINKADIEEEEEVETIIINSFKKHSLSYIDIFIYKHLKENYKNMFSKYIPYLSLFLFSLSLYFFNLGIIKAINNNKIITKLKDNNLKDNISYLKSIQTEIKLYKSSITDNSIFINNIIINKNWKTLNIDVKNKKFILKDK